ncbi:ABC multidrug transporter mdr1 [Niveomyces insectorum RCEF 264]|uniref:ABC multidrug transporter mdr1 n=1 Tax=Niveomyces insectorum RCEF 264 TaxID=1081102 RepID=A0A162I9L1_9HYPO|nr:ABC multidrug transporter mdr1 [Niveomyces insectorum RCEF 264]
MPDDSSSEKAAEAVPAAGSRVVPVDLSAAAVAADEDHATPPSSAKPLGHSEDSSDEQGTAATKESGRQSPNVPLDKADSRVLKNPAPGEEQDPYRHLPPDEAAILKVQVETPDIKVGFRTLYRYASRVDMIILAVSAVSAIASGAALPLMTVIFGNLQGSFQNFFTGELSQHDFNHQMAHLVLYFVYLAIGEYVTTYIATVGFIYTGEHISSKIREHYLESCMHQNIGFFDKLGAGEVTTRITADTNLVQEGISEKVGLTLSAVATFVTAFVIGFVEYWKMTLILLSTLVAIVTIMGGGSRFIVRYSKQSVAAYAEGGSVAEEVLSSIRNCVAFGTQDRLAKQYDVYLTRAEKYGFRVKTSIAMLIAGIMWVLYLNYGLAFYVGSNFLLDGSIPLSKVLIVMMAVMIGAFNLGNVAPNMQAFTTGLAAAAKIYNTIDRISCLDPSSDEGDKIDHLVGTIRLEHVKHIYPSRPEVVVMEDISLEIPAGKTTALVGASGSGKSTIVGLVERFYNPVQGTVYLDDRDIRTLNLRWLRQNIALVQQEPILFGTTIYENIAHGLIGSKHEHATDDEKRVLIEEAAKEANAHDFITSLPEGYETNVGERGFLLSGGQKQRIAIARAVVSDPKILLLDEATSALDTRSEGVVQAALDAASTGRTTITIAHRLSTIKDAHNIVVMSSGRIVEQGTHNELLERRGAYFNLVTAQSIAAVNEPSAAEQDAIDAQDDALVRKVSTAANTGESTDASAWTATSAAEAVAAQNVAAAAAVAADGEAGYAADPDDNIQEKLKRTGTQKSVSSLAAAAAQARKPGADRTYGLGTLIKLIASFNRSEWKIMCVALVFSAICGGGNPTQAVFFAKQISTMSVQLTPENRPSVRHDAHFWCLMYLMLAFVELIAFSIQGLIFARCSERLVHRARDQAFRTMLRQDIAFFDKDENTSGALTSFLSTEVTHVSGLSGATLGTILTVVTTLVSALILSIVIGWKLALVCTATIPILLGCGFFRFWMLAHYQRRAKRAYEGSASYAAEAITAIRTVASLTREDDVLHHYRESLAAQLRSSTVSILRSSSLYAASQSLTFLVLALGFWYGGKLLSQGEYDMFSFFVVFQAVVFGAQSAGTMFSFAPDMGKAKQASAELKRLFDSKVEIDAWADTGDRVDSYEHIEFREVHFRYPTRLEQPVLRGLNLNVHPGQYVALVGASGCGKSTTIALLERFYDPLSGGIYLDGKEISTLNVNEYRKGIALVSQEPTLYMGTIKENILLGAVDDSAVSDEAVEFACREANIYDFILSLPDGFNTVVGSKGALLSGGQKQRIAIARALIRDPKILLLDEATSALDSESEKVVQAALDKAAKGRTTIAVAHRLSTIQKADIIYVFDQGRIVEQGTHAELMQRHGRYAELVNLQSLGKN